MRKILLVLLTLIILISCTSIKSKEYNRLEIKEKIETMLMPDFRKWKTSNENQESDFTVMNDEVKKIIQSHNYGGIILFANNLKSTEQSYNLIQEIKKASKTPMLIATDQEGGIVARLKSGTRFPGNMALGSINDLETTYMVGKYISEELNALGINVNFAPSVDVLSNPNNTGIGVRSFSSDKERVAKHGLTIVKAMQDNNIIATAKHFPGHGDVEIDSHQGLPIINKSKKELEELELYPFKVLIDNDLDMLMTAHIALPKIEKETMVSKKDGSLINLPATLSKSILTDLLRKDLGYKGVIVTDALTGMKAITDNLTNYEALKKAVLAGADMLLMPMVLITKEDVKKLDEVVDKLVEDVVNGNIPISRINESYDRIMNLKAKRKILTENKANKDLSKLGSKEHKEFERKISNEAISMIKFTKMNTPKKILILTMSESQSMVSKFSIERLKEEGKIDKKVDIDYDIYTNKTEEKEVKEKVRGYDTVILLGSMNNASALKNDSYRTYIPRAVSSTKGIQTAYISINKPYDSVNQLDFGTVVIAYGYSGADPTEKNIGHTAFGPNIPAALEVIFENKERPLKLPIYLPKIKNGIIQSEILIPIK